MPTKLKRNPIFIYLYLPPGLYYADRKKDNNNKMKYEDITTDLYAGNKQRRCKI